MKQTPLTLDQYIQKLSSLSGMMVKDCYHTQDSMIRLLLEDEQRSYILIIMGTWQLITNNNVVCDSTDEDNLSHHQYYEKLRHYAAQIKEAVRSLSAVVFEKNGKSATLIFDNQWQLQITENRFGLLSYQNDKTQEYTIYSANQKSGIPTYYRAFP